MHVITRYLPHVFKITGNVLVSTWTFFLLLIFVLTIDNLLILSALKGYAKETNVSTFNKIEFPAKQIQFFFLLTEMQKVASLRSLQNLCYSKKKWLLKCFACFLILEIISCSGYYCIIVSILASVVVERRVESKMLSPPQNCSALK